LLFIDGHPFGVDMDSVEKKKLERERIRIIMDNMFFAEEDIPGASGYIVVFSDGRKLVPLLSNEISEYVKKVGKTVIIHSNNVEELKTPLYVIDYIPDIEVEGLNLVGKIVKDDGTPVAAIIDHETFESISMVDPLLLRNIDSLASRLVKIIESVENPSISKQAGQAIQVQVVQQTQVRSSEAKQVQVQQPTQSSLSGSKLASLVKAKQAAEHPVEAPQPLHAQTTQRVEMPTQQQQVRQGTQQRRIASMFKPVEDNELEQILSSKRQVPA
jgi:hypothetical protein